MSNPPEYTDEQVIEAARQGHNGPLEYFYNKGHKMSYDIIKGHGIENTGDIDDIYQKSFEIFLGQVLAESFILSTKLTTFLVGICKRQALKFKRANSRLAITVWAEEELKNMAAEEGDTPLREKQYLVITEEFEQLRFTKKECHDIIRLKMIEGKDYDTMSTILGKDKDVIKTQKGRCLKYLRKAIFKRMHNG
jgi:DNA-directed RNA polymerase specialized sigma24 family protein